MSAFTASHSEGKSILNNPNKKYAMLLSASLLSTEQKKRKRYKIRLFRLFIFKSRVEWQHNFFSLVDSKIVRFFSISHDCSLSQITTATKAADDENGINYCERF